MTQRTVDSSWRWNPRIATRSLDGTAFVLHGGRMLSLNEVGTRVWELFKDGATLSGVTAAIVEEFDVSTEVAAKDVEQFVQELLERELLVVAER